MPFEDLLGGADQSGGTPTAPTQEPATTAAAQGVQAALSRDAEVSDAELADVKKWQKEYDTARQFDKEARIQYAKDRRYAAGVADPNWASDANLIGSFIDILVSFLYAQNPDAGCRAAEQVGEQPNDVNTRLAMTLELVIDQLWKEGNLKRAGKKMVRSALTVGPGWFKATMLTQKTPAPQLEHELATQQDLLAAIEAKRQQIADGDVQDPDLEKLELQEKIKGLQAKLTKKQRYGLMTDFVRAEDIQVSLDVADLADYKDANWIANDIYVLKTSIRERFPRLTEDDIKGAATYYQKQTPTHNNQQESVLGDNNAEAGQFSKTQSSQAGNISGKDVEFLKIIEIWDRSSQLIRTVVDGVKKWAVEPYPPPQATKRFYSFFLLEFYPVDGQRHPQSLAWRLRKLQDEYSNTRSNQRLVRQRSIPGVIFDSGAIDHDEALKTANAVNGEMIPIKTNSEQPLQNIFIAKPLSTYNPELYNTEPILSDMERISGVQEALQQSTSTANQPKTATEASIQQTGFQSRTSSDRDGLEEVLDDLAEYTAECAIQECSLSWVQRVCGPKAFWLGPNDQTGAPGMDVEDLLTMVEVEIDAGTTGKPNSAADKANWATILPLLEKSIMQIRQAQQADPGLADALLRVLQETLRRMDDRLDLEEFIPKGAPTPPPPPPPPAPQVKVNVSLTGQLPPGDAQLLLEQSGDLGPAGTPLSPPSIGTPIPGMPAQIAPGIPMPPLSMTPPKPPKQPAGATPSIK